MSDKPPPKWALSFWSAGAVLFGTAFVYELVRNGFDLFQLATFVLFAAMAAVTWQSIGTAKAPPRFPVLKPDSRAPFARGLPLMLL